MNTTRTLQKSPKPERVFSIIDPGFNFYVQKLTEINMLIPKANRKAIHYYLFQEGVIVIKKDFNLPSHPELKGIPNLQVIKALQSLKSRGFVNEVFCWQYYYYILNETGIKGLRTEWGIPENVVPKPITKAMKTGSAPNERRRDDERERRGPREDYRRRDEAKKVGPSGDFKPEFRSGPRSTEASA